MSESKSEKVAISLPPALKDRIDAAATAAGTTRSGLIAQVMAHTLDRRDALDALLGVYGAAPSEADLAAARRRFETTNSAGLRHAS